MAKTTRRQAALESAEKLFAEYGFDAATMRMIADDAGVTLPLLTYHFKSKLNLYREVFREHQYLNELRLEHLARVDLSASDALDHVVAAFLSIGRAEPGNVRVERYLRVVLREAGDPRAGERGILEDLFDPMARQFISVFDRLFPELGEGGNRWAYLFATGALITSNFDDRERRLAGGVHNDSERLDLLQSFVVGGIRSIAAHALVD